MPVMPSKRAVLSFLIRDEPIAVVERFELEVRDGPKEVCRELGLDDSGREKSVIVVRLLGAQAATPPASE